jgi:hypothetical protein
MATHWWTNGWLHSRNASGGYPFIPRLMERATGWVGVWLHALAELGVRTRRTHARTAVGRSGAQQQRAPCEGYVEKKICRGAVVVHLVR